MIIIIVTHNIKKTILIPKYNSVMRSILTPVNIVKHLLTDRKSKLGYVAGNTWTMAMLEHCIRHLCVYM